MNRSAQTSLAPILPYLQSQQLGISSLLEGLAPADTPLAYEALTQLARANGLIEMEEEVRVSQDFQKAQRERQMNEVVEEVKFVPEVRLLRSIQGHGIDRFLADWPRRACLWRRPAMGCEQSETSAYPYFRFHSSDKSSTGSRILFPRSGPAGTETSTR